MSSLIEHINEIKSNLGTYVYPKTVSALAHYLNGYAAALDGLNKQNHSFENSRLLGDFSFWVGRYYGVTLSHGWWSIILFYEVEEDKAISMFFKLFAQFINEPDGPKSYWPCRAAAGGVNSSSAGAGPPETGVKNIQRRRQ